MTLTARCLLSSCWAGTGIKPTKSPPKYFLWKLFVNGFLTAGSKGSKCESLMPSKGHLNFHLSKAAFDFGTQPRLQSVSSCLPSSSHHQALFCLLTSWSNLTETFHVVCWSKWNLLGCVHTYCRPTLNVKLMLSNTSEEPGCGKIQVSPHYIPAIFSVRNLNCCWLCNWD